MRSISLLRRYRDPLVVLILLVVPLAFYLSNTKQVRDHNVLDRAVVWVSAPIQWGVVNALDGIANTWKRYVALVGVEEENAELRATVAELRAELAAREEQKLENERLRLLLDLRERSADVKPVTARLVATAPTPLFRSVRIDRGRDDGVHVGAAVVSYDGVVGRVAAVSGGWADVMLLVDANSSTDVLVQRTRARARVRGLGGDKELGVKVEYMARTEDVAPGDILITSGVGTVFPKGLRVGRIVSVEQRAFGLYQRAWVEPSVDFRRLEEVMVIPSGFAQETTYEESLGFEDGRDKRDQIGRGGERSDVAIDTAPQPKPEPVIPASPPEEEGRDQRIRWPAKPEPAPVQTPVPVPEEITEEGRDQIEENG